MAGRILTIVRKTGTGLVILALFLFAVAMLLATRQGYGIFTVQSDSMRPVLSKGSLLIINRHDISIRRGDVVSYVSPEDSRLIITHRVMEFDAVRGMFIAQGDGNVSPDTPAPMRNILGTATFKVPVVGYGFDALRKPAGLAALVYLPAIGIVASEIRLLRQSYTRHPPGRRYVLYEG